MKIFDIKLYDDGFFEWHDKYARAYSIEIGKAFVEKYSIDSLADFGCAIGSFLEGALLGGCSIVQGFDVACGVAKKHAPPSIRPFLREVDTTTPMSVGTFECVVSTEMAEHIDPDGTDQFLDNLCTAASRMILFTAAPPGRGDENPTHINQRPKEFWIKEIEARGFLNSDQKTQNTIQVWKAIGIKIPPYMFDSLCVFDRVAPQKK